MRDVAHLAPTHCPPRHAIRPIRVPQPCMSCGAPDAIYRWAPTPSLREYWPTIIEAQARGDMHGGYVCGACGYRPPARFHARLSTSARSARVRHAWIGRDLPRAAWPIVPVPDAWRRYVDRGARIEPIALRVHDVSTVRGYLDAAGRIIAIDTHRWPAPLHPHPPLQHQLIIDYRARIALARPRGAPRTDAHWARVQYRDLVRALAAAR